MSYTDSEPVTTTIQLQGVWIMDPGTGGQESARSFPYGSAQREEALDTRGETTFYAGRADPVTDYGRHEEFSVPMTVDVPHGPTWRTDLEALRAFAGAKRVLHVRDNRGRSLYGVLDDFRIRDTAWGSQVSFVAGRRSWVTEVVSA